jgi:uncharacterized protein with HEPN domain
MTQHDDSARLRHMLQYARKAWEVSQGHSREDLDDDEIFGFAMTRLIEVVGEAAARVGRASRERYPRFPGSILPGCAIA